MKIWLDVYPTGRKHCTDCKRWRHGIDFRVRKWADEPHCTVPYLLSSVCLRCDAARKRAKYGYKVRDNPWPHGKPGSETYLEHRRKRNRASYRERAKKKRYRAQVAEYQRIYRDAKKAEKRRQSEDEEAA